MKKLDFMKPVTDKLSKFKLKAGKYSPEICLAVGIIGIVGAVGAACYATVKACDVLEVTSENLEKIHKIADASEENEYSEDDKKKAITLTYAKTGIEFVKLYAPCAAFTTLAITSILSSHHIMKERNTALAAAYATLDAGFKGYRDRVIDRFGEQIDKELRYNIKPKEIDVTEKDEKTGEEKVVSKVVDVAEIDEYSEFARVFDESNDYWEKNAEYNMMFLRSQENWANEYLRSHKVLFLNDVYKALGFKPTKAGQIVGWIYDPDNPDSKGDNFVNFGIYNVNTQAKRNFINGYEKSIILDFNVDGNILDKI